MNNSFVSPADPVSSPNAQSILKNFMDLIAQAKGEEEPAEATPVAQENPQEQDQKQETNVSDMQRYLAPIKMNKFNADQGYTDSHHETFSENLSNDPVYEKIEPMIEAFSNSLKQGVASGAISQDRAQMEIENFKRNVIFPIVQEAHGEHSDTNKTSLLAKKKSEIPDFVKQVTGAK